VIEVVLKPGVALNLHGLDRNFYTTSSCGICGKASLSALQMQTRWPLVRNEPEISFATVHSLPWILHKAQRVFANTGGLHAAAIFDTAGTLLSAQEDVGRHNAVDRLIGALLLEGKLPAFDKVLFLSGRVSFELMQKALMAGIGIIAAVGAPSSLAVETARHFNATLIGFVREGNFNIYSGPGRIFRDEKLPAHSQASILEPLSP